MGAVGEHWVHVHGGTTFLDTFCYAETTRLVQVQLTERLGSLVLVSLSQSLLSIPHTSFSRQ